MDMFHNIVIVQFCWAQHHSIAAMQYQYHAMVSAFIWALHWGGASPPQTPPPSLLCLVIFCYRSDSLLNMHSHNTVACMQWTSDCRNSIWAWEVLVNLPFLVSEMYKQSFWQWIRLLFLCTDWKLLIQWSFVWKEFTWGWEVSFHLSVSCSWHTTANIAFVEQGRAGERRGSGIRPKEEWAQES